MESTHDRALSVRGTLGQRRPKRSVEVASRVYEIVLSEYIRREVALMTAYESIMVFLEILASLMSFGSLIIALLVFLDKEKNSSKKSKRK